MGSAEHRAVSEYAFPGFVELKDIIRCIYIERVIRLVRLP